MKSIKKQIGIPLALAAGILACGIASATVVTMNFDVPGLADGDQVATYYNGGCTTFIGAPDICSGPNYGVVWSGAGIFSNTSTSSGTIVPPSSPYYIQATNNNAGIVSATMNVAAGFGDTGFSFFYAGSTTVTVWSGLNGTGTQLLSETLGTSFCPSTGFCPMPFMLPFTGTAQSVVFTGNAFLDNVSFDMTSSTAVPEPAALGMFGLGVLLIGGFVGLRRRFN